MFAPIEKPTHGGPSFLPTYEQHLNANLACFPPAPSLENHGVGDGAPYTFRRQPQPRRLRRRWIVLAVVLAALVPLVVGLITIGVMRSGSSSTSGGEAGSDGGSGGAGSGTRAEGDAFKDGTSTSLASTSVTDHAATAMSMSNDLTTRSAAMVTVTSITASPSTADIDAAPATTMPFVPAVSVSTSSAAFSSVDNDVSATPTITTFITSSTTAAAGQTIATVPRIGFCGAPGANCGG